MTNPCKTYIMTRCNHGEFVTELNETLADELKEFNFRIHHTSSIVIDDDCDNQIELVPVKAPVTVETIASFFKYRHAYQLKIRANVYGDDDTVMYRSKVLKTFLRRITNMDVVFSVQNLK